MQHEDGSAVAVSATSVLRRFRVVLNTVRAHFQHLENHVGLGGAQVWALSLVRDQPGIGMGGIARNMDIHQSTASNLIKTLMTKQLISASRDPEDRRNVRLHILPTGLAVLGKLAGPAHGALPMALGKLPPETLERLNQDLGTLIQLLKADEQTGGIPLAEL